MKNVAAVVLLVASTAGGPAAAGNAACWGDDERQDITCAKITEPLVRGLIGASKAKLDATMGATGRPLSGNVWHFISNYDRGRTLGSGAINFVVVDGILRSIFGVVDDAYVPGRTGPSDFEFHWNDGSLTCSNVPGWSVSPCPE
jgi:hypothetical protein